MSPSAAWISRCAMVAAAAIALSGAVSHSDPVGSENPATSPSQAGAAQGFDEAPAAPGRETAEDEPGVQAPDSFGIVADLETGQGDPIGLRPVPLSINGTDPVNTTLRTNPPGLEIVVDEVTFVAPHTFEWENGSTHHIVVAASQALGEAGVRYNFTQWSDGGLEDRILEVRGSGELVAAFEAQFLVTVTREPPVLEISVDGVYYPVPYSQWRLANSTIFVHATGREGGLADTSYRFRAWDDGGQDSHDVLVDRPKTVTAVFDVVYLLTLETPFGTAECEFPACWYDEGDVARISISLPPTGGSESRSDFRGWTVQPGNMTLPDTTGAVLMDGPKRVTAEWVTQHHLSIDAGVGQAACDLASCWYDEGQVARLSSPVVPPQPTGTQLLFDGWTAEPGNVSVDGPLVMDGPKRVVAAWRTLHLLTVFGGPGNGSGGGWYEQGTAATVSLTHTEVDGDGGHWRFSGWNGAEGSAGPELEVVMDGPKEITAVWTWVAAPAPPPPPQRPGLNPLAAALVAAVALAATGAVVVSTPRGQLAFAGLAAPLFTRLLPDQVRSQFHRGRLIQFIEDNPGANYSEIRRRLHLSNGGCAYHLRVLERSGEVRRVFQGATVRFYMASYKFDAEALPPLAFVQRRILEVLVERKVATFGEILEALAERGDAVSEGNLSHHLKALSREKELVSTRRDGRKTTYYLEEQRRQYLQARLEQERDVDAVLERQTFGRVGGPKGIDGGRSASDVLVPLPEGVEPRGEEQRVDADRREPDA